MRVVAEGALCGLNELLSKAHCIAGLEMGPYDFLSLQLLNYFSSSLVEACTWSMLSFVLSRICAVVSTET